MREDRYVVGPQDDGGAVARAFEQLPVIVGTVHGRDYVFVAANAAYRAFSAERPILGLPAREVFAEALSQQVFEMLDLAYDTGQTQSGREWRIQLDRGAGLVDIYIDFVISPIVEPGTADGCRGDRPEHPDHRGHRAGHRAEGGAGPRGRGRTPL